MEHLLFLSQRIPYPPDKGDKIRSWRILQHLAGRHHVHLGCFYDAAEDARHIPFLATICASVCCQPLDPRWAKLRSLAGMLRGAALTLDYFHDRRLARWVDATLRTHRPPRIFVFCSAMAPYVRHWRDAIRVLDMVDVDSDKWRQYAPTTRWPASAVYAREHRRLLQFERLAAGEFDATLLVSPAEAELFRSLAPEAAARIHAMPNGTDAAFFDPALAAADPFPDAGPALVFTGAMDYWPNVQAVTWFALEVMPLLRRRWPALAFWIVGGAPTPAVRSLAVRPGIVVTGRVDDVRPYLRHAAAVVAPLRIARGVQNKVLEAMAMAKPVVATPEACQGIAATPGEDLLVAATAQDFADRLETILAGPPASLGARARARILRDYQWNFDRLDGILAAREPARIVNGGLMPAAR